ncbi:MAG: hypothetical protein IPJ30_23255 [Acidobacteria bacterium]|nr:hypothetical protein [Acidobacteriota bacterium]
MPYATQVVATLPRWYHEIHQDRLTPKYKAGLPYEEEIRFQMVRMTLPLTWGNVRDTNRLALEDYKGNWVCTVGKDNEVWRTLRWTVVAKGLPGTPSGTTREHQSRLQHISGRRRFPPAAVYWTKG